MVLKIIKKTVVLIFVSSSLISLYSNGTATVTNTLDSGPGSFRQAVLDTEITGNITFDSSISEYFITLTSGDINFVRPLNIITDSVNSITLSSSSNKINIASNVEIEITSAALNAIAFDINFTGDDTTIISTSRKTLSLNGNNDQFFGAIELVRSSLEIGGSMAETYSQGHILFDTLPGNSDFMLQVSDGLNVFRDIGVTLTAIKIFEIDVPSGIGVISGDISASSGSEFRKTGEGALVLAGENTYTGVTTVYAGVLTVNGSVIGEVQVSSGATINGTGSIGGLLTVNAGGSLTPGNSIGTIILDSLSLNPDAITNIEFGPTSTSLINVTNTATVAGTLNLTQNPGTYSRSGSYEILSATTLIDTFYLFSGGLPGFTFTLNSIDNSIVLQYTTSSLSPPAGSTGNIFEFANYLNDNALASYEYLGLTELSGSTLSDALNSASPARNAFPTFVTQQTIFSFSNLLNECIKGKRFLQSHNVSDDVAGIFLPFEYELIADRDSLQGASKDSNAKYALWIKGFADFAHQDGESQNVPFDFTSEGVLLGLDIQRCSKGLAGFAIGYANSQVEDFSKAGESNISYYVASLYASYIKSNVYLEGAFWGAFNQIHNQRNISYSDVNLTAKSSINGWQIAPHLEIGYIVCRGDFDFEPYLGVDYVVNWQGGTQETGAGNLNMTQKSNTSSMIQSELGLRFFQSFEKSDALFGLKESVSYINRTPFDTGKVTSAIFGSSDFFTLTSFTESQNLGAISFIYFAQVGKNRDVIFSVGYEGQFGADYMLNEVALSVSKSF